MQILFYLAFCYHDCVLFFIIKLVINISIKILKEKYLFIPFLFVIFQEKKKHKYIIFIISLFLIFRFFILKYVKKNKMHDLIFWITIYPFLLKLSSIQKND